MENTNTAPAGAEEIKLSGDTVDFTVTQEFLDLNPGILNENNEPLIVGEVIQVPKEVIPGDAQLNVIGEKKEEEKIEDDKKEEVIEETLKEEEKIEEPVKVEEPVKTFRGQTVISDGWRDVGEKAYHHLKLADGSTVDLTETDYQDYLNSNN